MRHGHHGGLGHGGVAHQRGLEGDGTDPLPAGLDQVLCAVSQLDTPLLPDGHDVAGLEPAVIGEPCVGTAGVEILSRDPRTAHFELAHRFAVPDGQTLIGARPHFDKRQRGALHRAIPQPVVRRQVPDDRRHGADRPERRHLGHPPRVEDVEPVALLEPANHRKRRGAPTHRNRAQRAQVVRAGTLVELLQQAEPHGGHACRQRHAFPHEQVEHARRVEVRPRKHLVGAEERRRKRQPPRVDVEHRHNRQDRVVLADRQRVAQPERERVQHDGPVRVEHALRPPGRPRRVAHRRRVELVDLRLSKPGRVRRRQHLLVVDPGRGRPERP